MRPIEEIVAEAQSAPQGGAHGLPGAAGATPAAAQGPQAMPQPWAPGNPWTPQDPGAQESRLSSFGETDEQAIERMWDALDPQALDWRSADLEPIVQRLRAARAKGGEGRKGGRKKKDDSAQLLTVDLSEIGDISWMA